MSPEERARAIFEAIRSGEGSFIALEHIRAALRERDAEVVGDVVAVVEAWWRSRGRVLQHTHAPNLASARIEASEVAELIRRIRTLRALPEEAGK